MSLVQNVTPIQALFSRGIKTSGRKKCGKPNWIHSHVILRLKCGLLLSPFLCGQAAQTGFPQEQLQSTWFTQTTQIYCSFSCIFMTGSFWGTNPARILLGNRKIMAFTLWEDKSLLGTKWVPVTKSVLKVSLICHSKWKHPLFAW